MPKEINQEKIQKGKCTEKKRESKSYDKKSYK
jgi:hypothetical protein